MQQQQGLVAFDLDGTLFDAARATVPAVQGIFEKVGRRPPTTDEICSYIGKPGSDLNAWLGTLCPPDQGPELVAAFHDLELRFVSERGRLYDGVPEMLAAVRARVLHMLVCTNGTQPYVDRVLTSQGLHAFFDRVRYRQSSKDTKPLMLEELLLRFPGRPAMVVGDRIEDMQAAEHNGIASIAVTYGYGPPDELRSARATAGSPAAILSIVNAILEDEPCLPKKPER